MNLINERKEEYYKYDLDISDKEYNILAKEGLKRIKEDKAELVNYAVNSLLKQYIDCQVEKLTEIENKENINGNKNSSKRKNVVSTRKQNRRASKLASE